MNNILPCIILTSFILLGCEKRLDGCFKDTEYEMCLYATNIKLFSSDSTENLLAINSTRYYKDSIKLLNENWDELNIHLDQGGWIEYDLSDGNYPLGVEINRTFYLKLEKEDTDTIFFNYRLKSECDYLQFTSFNAYYNSRLYSPYNLCPLRFNFYKE